MSLISVVLILIVVGVLLWIMERYIPMDAAVKRIIQVLVIVVVVLWLLGLFGLLPDLSAIKVGK